MATRSAAGMKVTAAMSSSDLLAYLIAISSSVTPEGLMMKLEDIPRGANAEKVGALALGASMNVKKVINDVRSTAGVSLPESWQINNDINFSMLAMLGHVIFMLPESALTPVALGAHVAYVKSIGGVKNIAEYTAASKVEGKEERSQILLKWAGQLRTFEVVKYQALLARMFPNLVKDSRSILGRLVGGAFSIITFPFRIVWYALRSIWSWFGKLLSYAFYILVLSILMGILAKTAFPSAVIKVYEFYGFGGMVVEQRSVVEASFETVTAIPAAVIRFAAVARNTALYMVLAGTGVATSIPAFITKSAEFAVEAFETEGKNIVEAFDGVEGAEVMAGIIDFTAKKAFLMSEAIFMAFVGVEQSEEASMDMANDFAEKVKNLFPKAISEKDVEGLDEEVIQDEGENETDVDEDLEFDEVLGRDDFEL